MSKKENKKFLIIDSRPFGLFSIFLHTVDNIYWAEQNGYIPVVRWGPGRWNPNCGRMGSEGLTGPEDGPYPGLPKGELIESTNFYNPNDPKQKLFESEHPPNFKEKGNMYGIKNCLYQDKKEDNPWEYFFEPLNEYTINDALSNEHLVSDIFQYGGNEPHQKIEFVTSNGDHFCQPDIRKIFIIDSLKEYGRLSMRDIAKLSINFNNKKEQQIRSLQYKYHVSRVNEIIKKITIKKSIMNKIDDFEKNNFNKAGKTLGVHIRGTDKCGERGESQNFGLRHYIKVIEQYLDSERIKFDLKYQKMTQIERDKLSNKEGIKFLYWKESNLSRVASDPEHYYKHAPKIFVATDSEQVVETLNSVFPGMIITYPSRRMPKYNNNTPIHLSKQSGRQHGEEALIETVLLSRCDTLIGSDSNMSIAAAYMNPQAEFTLIDTLDRRAIKPAVGCTILL